MMPHPHMLHWDAAHPGGQMVPLRQPTLPVYYNTGPGQHMPGSGGRGRWGPALHLTLSGSGSGTSSGLESPASEESSGQETAGSSCMSESSSTSGDTGPEPEHCRCCCRHQAGQPGYVIKLLLQCPPPPRPARDGGRVQAELLAPGVPHGAAPPPHDGTPPPPPSQACPGGCGAAIQFIAHTAS